MIEYRCPYCGAKDITGQPQEVRCVCGAVLYPGSGLLPEERFIPDAPGAEDSAGAVQTAQQLYTEPPPVQPVPVQIQHGPVMQQAQFTTEPVMQQPLYSPEQLRAAEKRRKSWHFLNTVMLLLQTGLFAASFFLNEKRNDFGVALLFAWMLSIPVFSLLSPLLRPDSAYLDRRPLIQSKIVHYILQFAVGMLTMLSGLAVFALLLALFI